MRNIRITLLNNIYKLFVLFLAGFVISCEDNNNSEPTKGGLIDGVYTVYAGNMYYNPTTITISQGDSITFINEEGFHDVYTTSGPVELSLNPCSGPCTIGTLVFEGGEKLVSIGLSHGAGRNASAILSDEGIEAPSTWQLKQDHPKRGFVWEVNKTEVDTNSASTFLMEATYRLCLAAQERFWVVSVNHLN